MEHSLDVHDNEGLGDLPEDANDLLHRKLLVLALVVVEQVALLAVLHHDLQQLVVLVEVAVVDLDQVGMHELLHHFDFPQRLLIVKGVHLHLLQGKQTLLLVLDQVHRPERTLPDYVHHRIPRLHLPVYNASKNQYHATIKPYNY